MQHKLFMKGVTAEELFTELFEPFKNGYELEKGKKIPDDIHPGFTYSKEVESTKKTVNKRLANIKLLKYKFPNEYLFEYRSSTYFKVAGFTIEEVEKGCNLLVMKYEEKLKDGKSIVDFQPNWNLEPIKEASIFEKMQYNPIKKRIKQKRLYGDMED